MLRDDEGKNNNTAAVFLYCARRRGHCLHGVQGQEQSGRRHRTTGRCASVREEGDLARSQVGRVQSDSLTSSSPIPKALRVRRAWKLMSLPSRVPVVVGKW